MPQFAPTRRQLLAGSAAAGLTVPFATSTAQAKPHRAAFDTSEIDRSLNALIPAGAVGATVSVVGPGGTHVNAAGRRDVHKGKALPQDRARVASVTKTMVAVLVMQRIEAGQWSLRTTIDQVVPGLYPGHGNVTVAQLMNHTSGMPDGVAVLFNDAVEKDPTGALLTSVASRYYSPRELVGMSRRLPWDFEPGTNWEYSNTGYVVLSIMLEEATGVPLPDLIRNRVFKPAGMHHSRLEETPLMRGRYLVPYGYFSNGLVGFPDVDPSIFSGAGAVYATMEDVTSFTGALMTGRLLPQELVDVMVTPVGPARVARYGYGVMQVFGPCAGADGTPEKLYGHTGSEFGTFTFSFSTRDGSRRAAVAWTGRPYTEDAPFADGNTVLVAGFTATCPEQQRPVTSARAARTPRAGGMTGFRL